MTRRDISGTIEKMLSGIKKNKYVLLVLLAGAVLLLLPGSGDENIAESGADGEVTLDFALEVIESKLEETLANIDGAGKVQVMLSVRDSGERVLATDSQVSESSGGGEEERETSREENETTVVISRGSGIDDVVTLQYVYPDFVGAIVVAEGAGSASVRLDITEAVRAVTGLDAVDIKVVKMK